MNFKGAQYREEFSLRLVIVTGMSGAGKTTALKTLEDMGFYCADNLPVLLIEKFAELVMNGQSEKQDIALGVDVRSGDKLGRKTEETNGNGEKTNTRSRSCSWIPPMKFLSSASRRRDAAIRSQETAAWKRESSWSGRSSPS